MVSADGGQSWAEAALQEPVLPKAFARFRAPWNWDGGPAVLLSRAWDEAGNVQQFLEKPDPGEITGNTINAGIYVLEPSTFDRIPKGTNWSIERSFFPSLVERHDTFVASIYDGYWIDIGTPEKYLQVHRDIMEIGRAHV